MYRKFTFLAYFYRKKLILSITPFVNLVKSSELRKILPNNNLTSMKICLLFILALSNVCKAQEWQAEIMAGVSGYNGDLTQQRVSIKQLRPAF